jgi:hypothetical protein
MDESDGDDKRSNASTVSKICIVFINSCETEPHTCPASSHSRCGKYRGGCVESLSKWVLTIVGGRYQAMLPTSDLSNLPAPAQAVIGSSRSQFLEADRGHVRGSNDKSVDSRIRLFATWLESLGYSKQSAVSLTNDQLIDTLGAYLEDLIDTLGAYLEDVKQGLNLQKMKLTGQSLRNYVTAAATCMALLKGKMPLYYDPATLSYKRIFLHPYLHEKIMQRTIWSKPEQLKEPFTYRMLAEHAKMLANNTSDIRTSFFGIEYVVWDWMRLGVFTGSRLAE